MYACISIIGHQADIVFPISVVGIGGIGDELVDHGRSLGFGAHGKAAYSEIERRPVEVGTLIVVPGSEIVVAHKVVFLVDALIALKRKQERVRGIRGPLLSYPAVVVTAVAEEQQVTGPRVRRRQPGRRTSS